MQQWTASLRLQDRASSSVRNLPLVQPIVWIGEGISDEQLRHVDRHVTNSEEFVLGTNLSSYQGQRALTIPKELQIDTGKTWTKQRITTWNNFLKGLLPIVEVDVVIPLGRNETWKCTCIPDDPANHSLDCQCDCKVCSKYRRCLCSEGKCICPPLCNCICSTCFHDHVNCSS